VEEPRDEKEGAVREGKEKHKKNAKSKAQGCTSSNYNKFGQMRIHSIEANQSWLRKFDVSSGINLKNDTTRGGNTLRRTEKNTDQKIYLNDFIKINPLPDFFKKKTRSEKKHKKRNGRYRASWNQRDKLKIDV